MRDHERPICGLLCTMCQYAGMVSNIVFCLSYCGMIVPIDVAMFGMSQTQNSFVLSCFFSSEGSTQGLSKASFSSLSNGDPKKRSSGWWCLQHDFYFSIQLGISSSQLINSCFSGRSVQPPPSHGRTKQVWLVVWNSFYFSIDWEESS